MYENNDGYKYPTELGKRIANLSDFNKKIFMKTLRRFGSMKVALDFLEGHDRDSSHTW